MATQSDLWNSRTKKAMCCHLVQVAQSLKSSRLGDSREEG